MKACPFCGSTDTRAESILGTGRVAAVCFDCEAHGPTRERIPEAVAAWNRRATRSATEAQAERARIAAELRATLGLTATDEGTEA